MDLSAEELRVLGCLVEKQLTTPQHYPLTLNALTLACNQTSNRDPVVDYDERTVEAAITAAKTKGLARFVHPSHGRSAVRFAHTLDEALGTDTRQLALLAVLALRGPQTPGELRSRTERMVRFDELGDIERELGRLADRDEPLVAQLPRRPGQKEVRFVHHLGDQTQPSVPAPGAGTPKQGRIVVGVDGSSSSKAALRWAAQQAQRTGAELEAVISWQYPTSFEWAPTLPADFDPGGEARQTLVEILEEVLGPSPAIEVRASVVEGDPASRLVEASRGADLLVVGSRGHGAFVGMLLGSVSKHCVSHAQCPVLVIRGPEES